MLKSQSLYKWSLGSDVPAGTKYQLPQPDLLMCLVLERQGAPSASAGQETLWLILEHKAVAIEDSHSPGLSLVDIHYYVLGAFPRQVRAVTREFPVSCSRGTCGECLLLWVAGSLIC